MKNHKDIIQGTDIWHHIRKGKITGKVLKGLMGTAKARETAIYELVAERLTVGVDDEYESDRDRGIRLEPEAIKAFEFETGKQVDPSGFCENDTNAFIGYSPDGLIADSDDTEDIEVKCLAGKNHVRIWLLNEIPDEHYWQMIQGFVVNPKLKTRFFVAYNPDIPDHKLHIIELHREDCEKDIEKAKAVQEKALAEIKELLKPIIKLK